MPSSNPALLTSASLPNPFRSEERSIAAHPHLGREEYANGDKFGSNFAGSLILHGLIAAVIVGWAMFFRTHSANWGENAATAGAIQASMVSALPLPNTQRTLDTGVLTSESPSPAPIVAKERTEPPPKPDEVAIPEKITKPIKTADKPTPTPPKHPQPTPPEPTKAATGETAGIRIAQSTMELRNGTASVSVQDRTFGARFAYYVNIVNQKVSQNWLIGEADPRASMGRNSTIIFDIDRDGTPSNIRVETASGSSSLDQSSLRAVQRVDGFGPLPAGDRITVEFTFHYHPQ